MSHWSIHAANINKKLRALLHGEYEMPCPACEGVGWVHKGASRWKLFPRRCTLCHGSGKILAETKDAIALSLMDEFKYIEHELLRREELVKVTDRLGVRIDSRKTKDRHREVDDED